MMDIQRVMADDETTQRIKVTSRYKFADLTNWMKLLIE